MPESVSIWRAPVPERNYYSPRRSSVAQSTGYSRDWPQALADLLSSGRTLVSRNMQSSTSLFASDYSLSTPTSPSSEPPSSAPLSREGSGAIPKLLPEFAAAVTVGQTALNVVFSTQGAGSCQSLPTPPASPMRRDGAQQASHDAAHREIVRKKSSFMRLQDTPSDMARRQSGTTYTTYEACMEGALRPLGPSS